MDILKDDDIITFGKYKGLMLQDVPASYFHYLWHNGMKNQTKTNAIARYIQDSIHAFKREEPNLIWD